jgi:hypothetical protein
MAVGAGGETVFGGDSTAFSFASRSGGYGERWANIIYGHYLNFYAKEVNSSVMSLSAQTGNLLLPGTTSGAYPFTVGIVPTDRIDLRGGGLSINSATTSAGTGTIYADGGTTVTGDGDCLFTTELAVGDIISEDDGATARITAIIDDNTLHTDTILTSVSGFPQSFQHTHTGLRFNGSGHATSYNSEPTAIHGLPYIVNSTNYTAQTSATTYADYIPTTDGYYRITFLGNITRAASSSSTLGPVWITYKDARDSATKNQTNTTFSTTANVTNISTSANLTAYCQAGTAITCTVNYTSSGGTTMRYNTDIIIEKF